MTLREQLLLHEGLRLKPYRDTVGKWTIGVGRNLSDKGLTKVEALILLDNDIFEAQRDLEKHLPWVAKLDDARYRVLVDMTFNMGIFGLLGFKRMLTALERGDYETAATEMESSKWAEQVGRRAHRLALWMRTGKVSL